MAAISPPRQVRYHTPGLWRVAISYQKFAPFTSRSWPCMTATHSLLKAAARVLFLLSYARSTQPARWWAVAGWQGGGMSGALECGSAGVSGHGSAGCVRGVGFAKRARWVFLTHALDPELLHAATATATATTATTHSHAATPTEVHQHEPAVLASRDKVMVLGVGVGEQT